MQENYCMYNANYWSDSYLRGFALDILTKGEANLEALSNKVRLGFKEVHTAEKIDDNIEFWVPFDQALDHWQRNVSGVFYLRAMMEIAVVATEMRWAGRRLRTLYNLSALHKRASTGPNRKPAKSSSN